MTAETIRHGERLPRIKVARIDPQATIEILSMLGLIEATAVLLGSVFDGELRRLRDLPVPPDRRRVDVRAVRETIGEARFAELLELGARMSYDEILDHIVAALNGV